MSAGHLDRAARTRTGRRTGRTTGHAERYTAWLSARDLPCEPTEAERQRHTYFTQHADPDYWEDAAGMKQHVQTCLICRANLANGTVDWDVEKWDRVLGPLASARPAPDRQGKTGDTSSGG